VGAASATEFLFPAMLPALAAPCACGDRPRSSRACCRRRGACLCSAPGVQNVFGGLGTRKQTRVAKVWNLIFTLSHKNAILFTAAILYSRDTFDTFVFLALLCTQTNQQAMLPPTNQPQPANTTTTQWHSPIRGHPLPRALRPPLPLSLDQRPAPPLGQRRKRRTALVTLSPVWAHGLPPVGPLVCGSLLGSRVSPEPPILALHSSPRKAALATKAAAIAGVRASLLPSASAPWLTACRVLSRLGQQ
jgi:hypothetical protein